jgi:class 3 adenylate cyclase
MTTKPTGTVTLLFSDIEDSTSRLAELGADRYHAALEQHRRILRDAVARHAGHEFGAAGDALFIAFSSVQDALRSAVAAQGALNDHAWPGGRPLRVRMGLHTCEALSTADDYVGIGVHRASRICAAGHGGQVLLSHTMHALLTEAFRFAVRDLGEHLLKDLPEPERLYQLLERIRGAAYGAHTRPNEFGPTKALTSSAARASCARSSKRCGARTSAC